MDEKNLLIMNGYKSFKFHKEEKFDVKIRHYTKLKVTNVR